MSFKLGDMLARPRCLYSAEHQLTSEQLARVTFPAALYSEAEWSVRRKLSALFEEWPVTRSEDGLTVTSTAVVMEPSEFTEMLREVYEAGMRDASEKAVAVAEGGS